jgi:hypothetical protein
MRDESVKFLHPSHANRIQNETEQFSLTLADGSYVGEACFDEVAARQTTESAFTGLPAAISMPIAQSEPQDKPLSAPKR